jgi:hypothetical protein
LEAFMRRLLLTLAAIGFAVPLIAGTASAAIVNPAAPVASSQALQAPVEPAAWRHHRYYHHRHYVRYRHHRHWRRYR